MACIQAQGSTLTIADAVGVPITIGEFMSWDGFDGSADEIECTDLASTAKEFKPGLQDFGNLSVEVQWDGNDLGQLECESARALQATRAMVLTVDPDNQTTGNVATFDAYIVSMSQSGATSANVARTIVFRITGEVTWT